MYRKATVTEFLYELTSFKKGLEMSIKSGTNILTIGLLNLKDILFGPSLEALKGDLINPSDVTNIESFTYRAFDRELSEKLEPPGFLNKRK